jgi:hypothetical protein
MSAHSVELFTARPRIRWTERQVGVDKKCICTQFVSITCSLLKYVVKVALFGLVVASMLETGPKICGFNSAEGDKYP